MSSLLIHTCFLINVVIFIDQLNRLTNSIEALSVALGNWGDKDGAVVIVSHDKAFCDTIAFTHVGTVMEGGLTVEERGLRQSDWDIYNLEAEGSAIGTVVNGGKDAFVAPSKEGVSARDSYDEKKARNEQKNSIRKLEREIDKIESDIQKLKSKKDSIQCEMDLGADKGWSILAELAEKLNVVCEEIESKEMRWVELSDQLEAVQISMKE